MPEPKPKRDYSARVRLLIAGSKKPRYFTTQRAAITMYRDLSLRMMQQGKPPRVATIEPVRGWTGLLDPAHLTVTSSGGVVVHRQARHDDFSTAASPVWPCGVQA